MLNKLKKWSIFVLLISPDSVAILFLGAFMEILYRIGVVFGFAQSGLEYLILACCAGAFILMFTFKSYAYVIKKRNLKNKL